MQTVLPMRPMSSSFYFPVKPSSYTLLHPIFYPCLTTLIPAIALSVIWRVVQPPTTDVFIPAANTTVQIAPLPQSFHHISAIHPLSSGLIIADHPTNSLFFLPNEGRMSHPFLTNAGGTNESHSVNLRRPGISALADFLYSDAVSLLVVARHAARDIAIVPILQQDSFPHPGHPITLADSFNGTRLNSPNSVHVDREGNIFFSDAYFGLVEEADEFDRKLDDPPGKTHAQNVYYMPASEVRRAIQQRGKVEPRLLIGDIDRPAGIAVDAGRLFISVASPRRPRVAEFLLEDAGGILHAKNPVDVYEWTGALHSWGQRAFSGALGNILIAQGRLFVGAGDGIAVFDTQRRADGQKPLAWVGAAIPPGPPTMAFRDGWLYVGASQKVVKMKVG